jgi:hypothetical protein
MLRLGNLRKEFGFFEECNNNVAYERLNRANLLIPTDHSKWLWDKYLCGKLAWLRYIPNVGARSRLGDHSTRCTHTIVQGGCEPTFVVNIVIDYVPRTLTQPWSLFKFSMGFHQVPNLFLKFPLASHFNPICFAQSPPLLTYICGPKGEAFHL